MRTFEARVSLFETRSGGRSSWIADGYRPPLRVGDIYFDGSFTLGGTEKMYPGDHDRKVTITVVDDARVFPMLRKGLAFEITEGPSSVVGEGVVLSVAPEDES